MELVAACYAELSPARALLQVTASRTRSPRSGHQACGRRCSGGTRRSAAQEQLSGHVSVGVPAAALLGCVHDNTAHLAGLITTSALTTEAAVAAKAARPVLTQEGRP